MKFQSILNVLVVAGTILGVSVAQASVVSVELKTVSSDGTSGKTIGLVTFEDWRDGVLIKPHLQGLSEGFHGFHLHQNASCAENGMAAGGHYDPLNTKKHLGPYGDGHLGDLPVIYVDKNDVADRPEYAPRLHVSDLKGHALMIHAGGDNYSDAPSPLGGGGKRVACAVVK